MAKRIEETVNSSTEMQGLTGGVELAQALSPADGSPVPVTGDAPAAKSASPAYGAPAPVPGDAPAATAAAPADGAPVDGMPGTSGKFKLGADGKI